MSTEDEEDGSPTGERGCGSRKAGGIYLCCGLSPFGVPINEFLIDPPQVLDFHALGIEPLGVKIITDPGTGISHVFDWVGSEHYLNVADFVEEAKRLGFSRRISKNADFKLLGRESRVYLIHERAMIHNSIDYMDWQCPTGKPDAPHLSPTAWAQTDREGEPDPLYDPCCAGIWWRDIEGGQPTPSLSHPHSTDTLLVQRNIPCGSYTGYRKFDDLEPQYEAALFMYFPLNAIEIVRAEDDSHEESMKAASKAQCFISLEDE